MEAHVGAQTQGERGRIKPSSVVLIIDDDRAIRDSLAMVLDNEGIEVVGAQNGAEGLTCLQGMKRPPDLIILDLMMPIMNGWEFRSAQLADSELAAIPTLVLTAAADMERHADDLGASASLGKPVDLDMLLEIVERLIPHWTRED